MDRRQPIGFGRCGGRETADQGSTTQGRSRVSGADLGQRLSSSDVLAAPTTTGTRRASEPGSRLADLGVYGFDRHETTILASLVTEDPLLLVGRSGTGKTFLRNTLSEALGLEHRHYNASLISFDDLVGFPYPDEAHATVRFLETPATVWGAEGEGAGRTPLTWTGVNDN